MSDVSCVKTGSIASAEPDAEPAPRSCDGTEGGTLGNPLPTPVVGRFSRLSLGFLLDPFTRVDRPSDSGHAHEWPDSIQFGHDSGGCPPHLAFFVRHYRTCQTNCTFSRWTRGKTRGVKEATDWKTGST